MFTRFMFLQYTFTKLAYRLRVNVKIRQNSCPFHIL